jgi:hypothetical protein
MVQLTHSNPFMPLGTSFPMIFTLPVGITTLGNFTWEYNCFPGESCTIFPGIELVSCPDPMDASIIGVKYRECGSLPYTNQTVIPGWPIQLFDADGNFIEEQLTGADGSYAFYDRPLGKYIIKEIAAPGWTPNIPASGQYTVDLAPSQQVVRNFGNCPSCSCDDIYMDVVQLPIASDTCSYALNVSNNGAYCFNVIDLKLAVGSFTSVTPAAGWVATLVSPQHYKLTFPPNYIPAQSFQSTFFKVTGAAQHDISVSTSFTQNGAPVTCSRPFTYQCPPPAVPMPCCPPGSNFGPELVKNSDFSLGNQDFTNNYSYFNPGNPTAIGGYSVLDYGEVYSANNQWACIDHTTYTTSGKMLIVDGYGGPVAWQQQVNVTAGTNYAFSAWVNNLVKPTKNYDDPQMALFVDGNQIAGPLNLSENPDLWLRLCDTFIAQQTGLVTLSIRMLATTGIGNDVAIDDVSLRACNKNLCIEDFETGGTGQWATTNGTISVITDPFTGSMVLKGNDNQGPSWMYNNSTAYSGDWTQKFDNCFCFDIRYDNGDPANPSTGTGAITIYQGNDPLNFTKRATFVVNSPIGNTWTRICVPVGLSNGITYPSNQYGQWTSTSPADFNMVMQGVSGVGIPLDFVGGPSPSEMVFVDNFCVEKCADTCFCGTWTGISYRPYQGAPNQSAECGDTLVAQCKGLIPWTMSGNFVCQGNACPPNIPMSWMLTKPDGSVVSGPMSGPNFNLSIPASDLNAAGFYHLVLKGICGIDTCYCEFEIQVDDCPCIEDFEIGGTGQWATTNGTISVITDPVTGSMVLKGNDNSGPSWMYNNSTAYNGDWTQKFNNCLCFDIRYDNGDPANPSTGTGAITIYQGNDPLNFIKRATFVVNTPIGNAWTRVCVPVGLSNGVTYPSNQYGQWTSSSPTDFNMVMQGVGGIGIPLDFGGGPSPSEMVFVDNFCVEKCTDPCTADIATPTDLKCGKYQFNGFANGLAPFTYCWDFDGNTNTCESTAQNPIWQFPASGTYTVTLKITDATGCMATYSVTMNVPPFLTSVTVSASQNPICLGQSVTLSASGTGATITSCTWQGGNTGQSIIVTPQGPSTWCVTCTDANGCTATDCETIEVKETPNVTATTASICEGDAYTIMVTSSPAATSYSWSPGGATTQNLTVTPSTTTTYTVTAGLNGCFGSATSTVFVNPKPTIQINGLPSGDICLGQTVNLNATGNSTQYQWLPSGPGTAVYAFTPTNLGQNNVSVQGTLNGCTNTVSGSFNVVDCPCIEDFETGSTGQWATVNGNISVITDPFTGSKVLKGNDNSGPSWMFNNSSAYNGNWTQKFDNCLCFDIRYDNGDPNNPATGTGAITIYQGSDPLNTTNRATFLVSSPIGNSWTRVCAPVRLASGTSLPSNSYGTWTNAPTSVSAFNSLITNVNGIGYALDFAGGNDPSEMVFIDNICVEKCDTCYCGTFSNLFARPTVGAPSIPLMCGGSYNFPCPNPGQSIPITGKFECQGTNCPTSSQISWTLIQPDGMATNGTVQSGPYFFLPIMPLQYAQVGTYTLILKGNCGGTDCPPCIIKFTVDCPNPCPCDVPQFQKDVAKGFATALWPTTCKGCFSPISLNDCDMVEWKINGGPSIGMTSGNQSFCHTFTGAGTYTVTMIVTRKKSDGSLCEVFTFSKSVMVTCMLKDPCDDSVFPNSAFSEGAVVGGLNSGGASTWWKGLYGDPQMEHTIGSLDNWAVLLTGHIDSADVLSSDSSVCMKKESGTLMLRGALAVETDSRGDHRLAIFFNREDSYVYNVFNPENCFMVAKLDITNYDDTSWFDLEIPYDLSTWGSLDTCGDAPHGVLVRPIIYAFTCFETAQGADTRTRLHVDNLCFDNQLVDVKDPIGQSALRIYPNPNPGTFTVEMPVPAQPGTQFRIIDLAGRLVQDQKTEPGSATQTVRAGELPTGLYFLQLLENGRVIAIEKFVKQ